MKISRTGPRRHCKKLEEEVDTLLAAFPADGYVKLKVLKTNYEAQIAKVNAASEEISALITTEEDLTKDVEETSAFMVPTCFSGYSTVNGIPLKSQVPVLKSYFYSDTRPCEICVNLEHIHIAPNSIRTGVKYGPNHNAVS